MLSYMNRATNKSCGCREDVECGACCTVTECYACGAEKTDEVRLVLRSNWNGSGWDRAGICDACRAAGVDFIDRPRQPRRPRQTPRAYGDYGQMVAFLGNPGGR